MDGTNVGFISHIHVRFFELLDLTIGHFSGTVTWKSISKLFHAAELKPASFADKAIFACEHVCRGVQFSSKQRSEWQPESCLVRLPYYALCTHTLMRLCSDKQNLPIDITCMYVDLIYMKLDRLYLVLNGTSFYRPRCFDVFCLFNKYDSFNCAPFSNRPILNMAAAN